MRIIDKKQDFYDYLQDPTDRLVFDRRGSFLITKEDFYEHHLVLTKYYDKSKYRFVLLQCGATFWLFLVNILETNSFNIPKNGNIELLTTWKNYDLPNDLLVIKSITFKGLYGLYDYKTKDFVKDRIIKNIGNMKSAIDHKDILIHHKFGRYSDTETSEVHYPLLKACGIGNLIDPITMFCAIEEYFSIEKTKSESTEAKGTTNDDKIIMHGFDTKTSFRGK